MRPRRRCDLGGVAPVFRGVQAQVAFRSVRRRSLSRGGRRGLSTADGPTSSHPPAAILRPRSSGSRHHGGGLSVDRGAPPENEVDFASYETPEALAADLRQGVDRWTRVADKVTSDALFMEGMRIGLGFKYATTEEDDFVLRLVHPGSPAGQAGLERGDLILAVNGTPAADVTGDDWGPNEEGSWSRLTSSPRPRRRSKRDPDHRGRRPRLVQDRHGPGPRGALSRRRVRGVLLLRHLRGDLRSPSSTRPSPTSRPPASPSSSSTCATTAGGSSPPRVTS